MSGIMMDYNQRPQDDMGGLSPEQVYKLIHADWDAPDAFIPNSSTLPLEELKKAPFLHDMKVFLQEFIDKGGSIKATSAGNLNRQFVQKMMEVFSSPSEIISWVFRYKKTLNEDDAFHVHLVRILASCAGLIRKQKTVFKITKKGEKYTQDQKAAELYVLLFKTYFRKFNLAYLDGMPQNQPLQETIAFSFYTIKKQLREWKSAKDIAEQVTLPIVQESVFELRDLDIQVKIRILESLVRFGLLENRELPKEEKWHARNYEYRKTSLYDTFFVFSL